MTKDSNGNKGDKGAIKKDLREDKSLLLLKSIVISGAIILLALIVLIFAISYKNIRDSQQEGVVASTQRDGSANSQGRIQRSSSCLNGIQQDNNQIKKITTRLPITQTKIADNKLILIGKSANYKIQEILTLDICSGQTLSHLQISQKTRRSRSVRYSESKTKSLSRRVKRQMSLCKESGGEWKTFNDGCADSCYDASSASNPRICTMALTDSCDCGVNKCWSSKDDEGCINQQIP